MYQKRKNLHLRERLKPRQLTVILQQLFTHTRPGEKWNAYWATGWDTVATSRWLKIAKKGPRGDIEVVPLPSE
jgi:hypothetical protein